MLHFPTKVFNERVAVFIDAFYEEMARLYHSQGWPWEAPREVGGTWNHPDFTVRIASRFKDGAAHIIELTACRLPGVERVDTAGHVTLRREHRFRVSVPRSYPSNLGAIEVQAATRLYHPRLARNGTGHACIFVNGEIDRVLWSIVRHILLDPDYVQPPKLFKGVDYGTNLEAMIWYEANPVGIHKRLLELWAQDHGAEEFVAAEKRAGRVEIKP